MSYIIPKLPAEKTDILEARQTSTDEETVKQLGNKNGNIRLKDAERLINIHFKRNKETLKDAKTNI